MRYRKSDKTVEITVTELASFARSVEHAGIVSEKYGFRQLYDGDTEPGENRASGTSVSDGERLHRQLQADRAGDAENISAAAEADLAWATDLEGMHIELHGRSDSIAFDGQMHTVEECKTVSSFRNDPNPFTVPAHFAQAVCYAFILCETGGLDSAAVQITFVRRQTAPDGLTGLYWPIPCCPEL